MELSLYPKGRKASLWHLLAVSTQRIPRSSVSVESVISERNRFPKLISTLSSLTGQKITYKRTRQVQIS